MLHQALDSTDPREVLQYIHDVNQTHNGRVRTLEVRYRFKLSWNHEHLPEHLRRDDIPLHDTEKQGEFGRSGEKWYSVERFTTSDRPGQERQSRSAFDGRLYSDRQVDEVPRFASTTEADRVRPGTPDPRDMAEIDPLSHILNRLGTELTGCAVCRIEQNGRNCIQFKATRTRKPLAELTVLYDADRLFVTIAWKSELPDRRRDETVEYTELRVDGEQVFFPVHVQSTDYYRGQVIRTYELQVDPDSIRINQPIPDARFTITPEPGDLVQTDPCHS